MSYRIIISTVLCLIIPLTIVAVKAKQTWPFPVPTGPYQVSFKKLGIAADPNHITIYLWYPKKPRNGMIHHTKEQTLPAVLFAPGWDGRGDDSSALTAELASHGYIVIGFDDVGQDRSDGKYSRDLKLEGAFDLSSHEAERKSVELANMRLQTASLKVKQILDALQNIDSSEQITPYSPNFEKIGFMGFSFGGAVAAETAHLDSRIKAVANLDGWLFAKAAKLGVPTPYIAIASAEAFPPSSELQADDDATRLSAKWCRRDESLHQTFLKRTDFHWFLAKNAKHEDFTDRLFSSGLLAGLMADSDGGKALHMNIATVVRSFFDAYLKQKPSALIAISGPGSPSPLRQLTETSRP